MHGCVMYYIVYKNLSIIITTYDYLKQNQFASILLFDSISDMT